MADNRKKPHEDLISEHEYHNPVDRYAQLPEWKREWLEQLTPREIKEWEEEREFWRSIKSTGRMFKWLIGSAIAILLLMSQFGEALQKTWHTFFGWRGP